MRGFTLVETIVAAAIVAVAVVAVAHLAAIGIRQSSASTRALTALVAAQGKLEALNAAAIAIGAGEQRGEVVLRWTIAPLDPADPSIVSVQVCAFPLEGGDRPNTCVATVRRSGP